MDGWMDSMGVGLRIEVVLQCLKGRGKGVGRRSTVKL